MGNYTDSPSSARNNGQFKPPGLPPLLLINRHQKLVSEMNHVAKSMFDVSMHYNTAEAMGTLIGPKTPKAILIGYSSLLENGQRFLKTKEDTEALRDIPLIITGKVHEEELKANLSINSPLIYLKRPFLKSQLTNAMSKLLDSNLEEKWQHLPEQQKRALSGSLESFGDLSNRINNGEPLDVDSTRKNCQPITKEIEEGRCLSLLENVKGHHNYTYVHSLRVSSFLSLAAQGIGIKGDDLLTLTTGGLLHDVGKVATPQEILNCPTKLEDDEWLQMKGHVNHTHRILDSTPGISDGIRIIAEQHHEKLDGTGYPLGLKGNQLSELARLSTIADIFSALTDERSYKPAFSYEKSFSILKDMEGQIDMQLLAIFEACLYAEKEKENH